MQIQPRTNGIHFTQLDVAIFPQGRPGGKVLCDPQAGVSQPLQPPARGGCHGDTCVPSFDLCAFPFPILAPGVSVRIPTGPGTAASLGNWALFWAGSGPVLESFHL